jgi:hypothetical protein
MSKTQLFSSAEKDFSQCRLPLVCFLFTVDFSERVKIIADTWEGVKGEFRVNAGWARLAAQLAGLAAP